jgi:hypothetical protein
MMPEDKIQACNSSEPRILAIKARVGTNLRERQISLAAVRGQEGVYYGGTGALAHDSYSLGIPTEFGDVPFRPLNGGHAIMRPDIGVHRGFMGT